MEGNHVTELHASALEHACTARIADRGVLYELEQRRLRRNSAQQLRNTAALCDELLIGGLLPAATVRELRMFRADIADAIEFHASQLAERMISCEKPHVIR